MIWLQSNPLLHLPNIRIPVLGNTWLVGFLFLAHILFASFSMGVVLLSPTYELVGHVRQSRALERLAQGLASANIRVFSLGATLGAFAVFSLTGLYGSAFIPLVIRLWEPMLIAFVSWFLTIPLLLVYTYRWIQISERTKAGHIALGYLGGISENLFLFLIVGLDSFMLTPNSGGGFGALFNGSFWPEFFHRFTGNLSWGALMVAGVLIAWRSFHREERERAYYAWAARVSLGVGVLLLVPQAIEGWFFARSILLSSPGAFVNSFAGPWAPLWLVQQFLVGAILVAANVYLAQTRAGRRWPGMAITVAVVLLAIGTVLPAPVYGSVYWVRYLLLGLELLLTLFHFGVWNPLRRSRPEPGWSGRAAVVLAGAAAVMVFLLMGVIRETARNPWVVYGQITQGAAQNLYRPPSPTFYP